MFTCPCGSKAAYASCCEPYLKGERRPSTPEALMRSRYTAYTQANIDYIAATMRGNAAKQFNRKDAMEWARNVKWLGLTILSAPPTLLGSDKGVVEFIARYDFEGREWSLHEKSQFTCIDGRWFYTEALLK